MNGDRLLSMSDESCIEWIKNIMGDCISTKWQQLGFALGLMSTLIWMYAQIPQLILNCRQRGVQGLSGAFCTLLVVGDLMNLTGIILAHGLATQVITAVWFTFVDGSVFVQWLYYCVIKPRCFPTLLNDTEPVSANIPPISAIPLLIGSVYSAGYDPYDKTHIFGSILGWGSAACYISSRCPQIYTNYKRKKTEGVSIQYFLSALFGNTTYAASIFLKDASWGYIWLQFPWLLGSLGILFFDATVICQFRIYRKPVEYETLGKGEKPKPLVDEQGEPLESVMD
jgi:uncharacterized protein with PQ loop repeat